MSEKDRPISKPVSVTFRSQYLKLDDNRHLLGITFTQTAGDPDAGRAGEKGDEEVVVAGKPGARDLAQDLAHDANAMPPGPGCRSGCGPRASQPAFLNRTEPDVIKLCGRVNRGNWRSAQAMWRSREKGRENKWRFLLPGTSEPRLEVRTART